MTQKAILIVEDDAHLRDALDDTLGIAGYRVKTAADGEQALKALGEKTDIALVISDVQMRPMDGYTLLKRLKETHPEMPVVLMTAYGTIDKAVGAMRNGAADFLVKPFEAEVLLKMAERFMISVDDSDDGDMVTADPSSKELARLAQRVAASDATVMITGESGVGKEVLARYIHNHSDRAGKPFVAINCAAIPENMLEAELFGYEKGAFTGAHQARPGKFEQAQGGTLLLDEVTEMDKGLQTKLLRVLQEREVERLGGRRVIELDVRVLATSNRDLRQTVLDGEFREDLYYRLNVLPIELPPLRNRREDILPLARKFILRHLHGQTMPELCHDAMNRLHQYDWPGNVRELENVIQRALILKCADRITARDIHFETMTGAQATKEKRSCDKTLNLVQEERLNDDLKQREADLILNALEAGGSRTEVAQKLGISPRTLRYKLAKLRDAGVPLPA
ncbi:sigma-54-dependent transcriptional regulator [Thiolapillus sp.]